MKCLEDDLVEKEAAEGIAHNEIADEAKEVEAGSLQVSTTGEFLHPGATARNVGALLPDLLLPPVRTGSVTAAVSFVTSAELILLAASEDTKNDWIGKAVFSKWDIGKDFTIPTTSSADLPYRTSFVVHSNGVIPL